VSHTPTPVRYGLHEKSRGGVKCSLIVVDCPPPSLTTTDARRCSPSRDQNWRVHSPFTRLKSRPSADFGELAKALTSSTADDGIEAAYRMFSPAAHVSIGRFQ
jgi:hypothetical protein